MLKLFSVFDSGVSAYLRPFWSDHKMNAIRSVTRLVNDTQTQDSIVADHPEQFVLFELGEFDEKTGVFTSHPVPMSLGCCIEFKNVSV